MRGECEENAGSDNIELSAEQLARLGKLTPVTGDHHNEEQMRLIEH